MGTANNQDPEEQEIAKRLAEKTGITEAEALALVKVLGNVENSLLREARIISAAKVGGSTRNRS